MKFFNRLFRTAAFLPLAFAGLFSVIAAQMTIIFGVIFVGIAAPAMRRSGRNAREATNVAAPRRARDEEEPAVKIDSQTLSLLPLTPIAPDSLVLLRNEQCYLQEDAELVVHDGGRFNVDGFGRFSQHVQASRFVAGVHDTKGRRSKTATASGRVYVTNTRIVFIGGINVNMHIAQILSLDAIPDGVSLSFVSEKPMDVLTGNVRLALVLQKVIARANETASPLG